MPSGMVALGAACRLFENLNQTGIRYCHWKSNLRLPRSLQGKTDLDVLVDRTHSGPFRQLLHEHGIKPLLPAPGKHYPGLENYLGFDAESGRLFHLHVHYQLVLGEQFVKNYRLPLETRLLDSTRLQHAVKIPTPDLELAILCIRALLKYRNLDAIKDTLKIRSPGLPAHIRDEFDSLLEQATSLQAAEAALPLGGAVAGVVRSFLDLVVSRQRAGLKLLQLRRQLRRSLRPYQRESRWLAAWRYARASARQSIPRLAPRRKMSLPGGGLTLALVGIDGAGKSTMTRRLHEWLAWKLDVHLCYLGSKQSAPWTAALYMLFRGGRRVHSLADALFGERNILTRLLAGLQRWLLGAHYVAVGADRARRYAKAWRQAARGACVLFDRFPLEASLDGPRIGLPDSGAVMRTLGRLERRFYRRIQPPDALVVMAIDPGEALRRKPHHNPAAVEDKSRILDRLCAQFPHENRQTLVFTVNAAQAEEMVLNQLKAIVWNVL
jgi:thymidylate kinase